MRREDVVAATREWLGTPYRHHSATRRAGCDCLGLICGVWRDLGGETIELPAYRADWRDTRHADALLALAERRLVRRQGRQEAGQVILFEIGRATLPRHCGIAVDEHGFVHAQEGRGVVMSYLTAGWRKRVAGLFDFPGVA
jgi:NlpC/P60 family putative phage cell wall peptidase